MKMNLFQVLCCSVLVVSLCGFGEALKCYQCEFIEEQNGRIGDKSCKSGKTPKDKFLVDCPGNTNERNFTCGKTVDEDKNYKATFRGCLINPTSLTYCDLDIGSNYQVVKGEKFNWIDSDKRPASRDTCACKNEDGCNNGSTTFIGVFTLFQTFWLTRIFI